MSIKHRFNGLWSAIVRVDGRVAYQTVRYHRKDDATVDAQIWYSEFKANRANRDAVWEFQTQQYGM